MTDWSFTMGAFLMGMFVGAFSTIKGMNSSQEISLLVFSYSFLILIYSNRDFLWNKLSNFSVCIVEEKEKGVKE